MRKIYEADVLNFGGDMTGNAWSPLSIKVARLQNMLLDKISYTNEDTSRYDQPHSSRGYYRTSRIP